MSRGHNEDPRVHLLNLDVYMTTLCEVVIKVSICAHYISLINLLRKQLSPKLQGLPNSKEMLEYHRKMMILNNSTLMQKELQTFSNIFRYLFKKLTKLTHSWRIINARNSQLLTIICVGFFRVCFEVEGGRELPPPLMYPVSKTLKLVRIMRKTSNLTRKYTQICSFRKYSF